MKILFVTNYYPPFEKGGYEQLCRDVAESFRDRGHQIMVLTSKEERNDRSANGSAAVRRSLHVQPDYDSNLHTTLQFFLTRRRAEFADRQTFREVVAEFRPDVVFFWNLEFLTRLLATDAEAIGDVNTAYWIASRSPAEPDEFWTYWNIPVQGPVRRATKSILRQYAHRLMQREGKPVKPKMEHVAVVSEYVRQKGIEEHTLPAHVRVIPNGIDFNSFKSDVGARSVGPLQLLQAGRLSHDKGVHTSVEAIGYLVREHGVEDVHLTVAGTGPRAYQQRLERIISHFGIDEKVTFTGWVSPEQMPGIMHASHVLLLPSIVEEAFARVVLEAMAAGLAVISTLTGGTGELVRDGQNGLVIPVDDSPVLANQILRLSRDDQLRCQLARAGQEIVGESFTIDKMVDSLESFLDEVLATTMTAEAM